MKEFKFHKKTGELKCYPWGAPIKKKLFTHEDIVSYYNKDVVEKIGEGEDEFIIKKKVTEYDRMNRDDFIKSHAGEVGVKNQIARALRDGESVSYVMNDKFKSKQEGFVDMIKIEDTLRDPEGFSKKIKESYDKLPKELRDKKSARDISKMSESDVQSFISSEVEKYLKAREKKPIKVEGEKENG